MLWDTRTWNSTVVDTGGLYEVHDLNLSPDSTLLTWADANGEVRIVHVPTRKLIYFLDGDFNGDNYFASFTADGKWLITGEKSSSEIFWAIDIQNLTATYAER